MMNIARENNLSETAFAVKEGDAYHLRWFTPGGEIDLCGHATLACAFVLLNFYESDAEEVEFETLSGHLAVMRKGDLYEMDFPAYELKPVPVTDEMADAIGAQPTGAFMGRDLMCVFDDASLIRTLEPDQEKVRALDGLLLHVTAPGTDTDCVSRSFAPKCGVTEDPVCGSGHCHIVPYWARTLHKDRLIASQASRRGGTLYCQVNGDRVFLAGKACLYAVSELFLEDISRIRIADPKDIRAIADTYTALLTFERENGSHSNWQLGVYPTVEVAEAKVPAREMYVLEDGGEICASMVLNHDQADEYAGVNWLYPAEDEQVLVIHTLCIPPEKAGRGYGTQMIEYAKEFARKKRCSVIRIDTYSHNEPAKALYQKNGFRIAGYGDILLQGLIPEEQVYLECLL